MRANGFLAACSLAVVLAAPARAVARQAAPDSLVAARQLYASAEYSSALTMLTSLLAANPSPQERQSIELYRVFCLFAVNDLDEANGALEAMILRNPLYRPSADEVPRRLRTIFTETRKRLLPSIIEEKYVVAKAAFDRGDFEVAAAGFRQMLLALADDDIAAEAAQRPLADLRVLAAGFSELAVRAITPAPEPPAPAPAPAPASAATAAATAETPAARVPHIYDSRDANVTPPVVVRQDLPPLPRHVNAGRTGQLEVVIDETGTVESATIVTPIDPWYNTMVLAAAKAWRYRPATADSVPVKFRKRIQIRASDR